MVRVWVVIFVLKKCGPFTKMSVCEMAKLEGQSLPIKLIMVPERPFYICYSMVTGKKMLRTDLAVCYCIDLEIHTITCTIVYYRIRCRT